MSWCEQKEHKGLDLSVISCYCLWYNTVQSNTILLWTFQISLKQKQEVYPHTTHTYGTHTPNRQTDRQTEARFTTSISSRLHWTSLKCSQVQWEPINFAVLSLAQKGELSWALAVIKELALVKSGLLFFQLELHIHCANITWSERSILTGQAMTDLYNYAWLRSAWPTDASDLRQPLFQQTSIDYWLHSIIGRKCVVTAPYWF